MKRNLASVGLGKTLFNSGVTVVKRTDQIPDIEIVLTERHSRKKASGAWPEMALKKFLPFFEKNEIEIAENRDVLKPSLVEEHLNRTFPFFEYLKSIRLDRFSSHFNQKIQWIPHHLCHAYAAMMMSPFRNAIIMVLDGAGSNLNDFTEKFPERDLFSPGSAKKNEDQNLLEECSIYLLQDGKIECVEKYWQYFYPSKKHSPHWFSSGLGTLYEKSAEFIFNDKRASGKVMGLAAFGRAEPLNDRIEFLENLPWTKAFHGKSKKDWEASDKFSLFANVAASVQQHFEVTQLVRCLDLKNKFPLFKNLIITGGCALNCTTNMKIFEKNIFDSIYVPPFPGDECISLGAASYIYHNDLKNLWQPYDHEIQSSYHGCKLSVPVEDQIKTQFQGFNVFKPQNIAEYTAEVLAKGAVIAWFQGRSETGPRSLGNRSILVRADRKGVKEYLNSRIKFRESFRPYGSSVLFEKSHEYFEVPQGFENPFMSFAVNTRPEYLEKFADITHQDGTSRMQTVRKTQNPLFYELIEQLGKKTGVHCVLNTSLNIMGEPIVETVSDARRFLESSSVDGLAIGDFYITKKSN